MFNFVFPTLVSTPQYQKMSDESWPSWMGLLVVLLLSIMAIAFARCYSPNQGTAMLDGPTANMSMGAMATHGMSVNISMGVMIGINDKLVILPPFSNVCKLSTDTLTLGDESGRLASPDDW